MELRKLQALAGSHSADDYPESGKLLDCLVDEMREQLAVNPQSTPEHLVAAALAGLTQADLRGYISVGDEHEWATLSLVATERAWAVS
jgi:hypothetical protein